ncbi:UDP-glucose dehydrogenase family protein [Planococcus lenghuensis]|uniref:UDP-glucose 6-dehydrogenase n=1 Tax=Planococcus lenghuensis TaxID=2213202 RepID=A0A1Q2KZ25_9BACL|nr:UDP-glucose/GDP-mannose dehydrogenase family protein [Planococcus lenghuensis]AQQ53455.1 UDP-glucose 6-dehydrogenase [Planococcus lenghuensis]
MMKIAVAGAGYVGLVTGVCFAEMGHHVICVDKDTSKIESMKTGVSPIFEPGLQELMRKNISAGRLEFTTDYKLAYRDRGAIFIAVGTPERLDGAADLTHIEETIKQIAGMIEQDSLIVIKSTVPVGTAEQMESMIRLFLKNDVKVEVASNPEFMSQGSAIRDTLYGDRIIIGTASEEAEILLRTIYEPFELPIVTVSRKSAELTKLAANGFLALKISYMNDIAALSEAVGADIQEIAKGMRLDGRIGSSFLNAGIGFGGSCLPKDIKALDVYARENGQELKMIKAAREVNDKQQTVLFRKAKTLLEEFHGLKIAVLGLTFKPETDDIRNAASLVNIELLLKHGAEIQAYDPTGAKKAAAVFPEGKHGEGTIAYSRTLEQALEGADVCFIFTEWEEIKSLRPALFKRLMHSPYVFDGRNLFDLQEMDDAGIKYTSIGR